MRKKFLSKGINIVSPSVADLIWSKGAVNQEFVKEIQEVAKKGKASICSNTIKSLTISEMYNYSTAPLREEMAPTYGFDELPEYKCMLESSETQLAIWGLTIHNIANHLGYEVEEFTTSFEK